MSPRHEKELSRMFAFLDKRKARCHGRMDECDYVDALGVLLRWSRIKEVPVYVSLTAMTCHHRGAVLPEGDIHPAAACAGPARIVWSYLTDDESVVCDMDDDVFFELMIKKEKAG